MYYEFKVVPRDPKELPAYLDREMQALSLALSGQTEKLRLKPLGAEPKKYSEGDVVYANGTTWNPGSGAGPYVRGATTWKPLA